MDRLRTRLFLRFPDGSLKASDLEIELPQRFHGFPNKPVSADDPPIYQAIAHFPGVLDAEGFAFRARSTLEAMTGVMTSVIQFWKSFEKAGGAVHQAMADDEDVPNLEFRLRSREFFGY